MFPLAIRMLVNLKLLPGLYSHQHVLTALGRGFHGDTWVHPNNVLSQCPLYLLISPLPTLILFFLSCPYFAFLYFKHLDSLYMKETTFFSMGLTYFAYPKDLQFFSISCRWNDCILWLSKHLCIHITLSTHLWCTWVHNRLLWLTLLYMDVQVS